MTRPGHLRLERTGDSCVVAIVPRRRGSLTLRGRFTRYMRTNWAASAGRPINLTVR